MCYFLPLLALAHYWPLCARPKRSLELKIGIGIGKRGSLFHGLVFNRKLVHLCTLTTHMIFKFEVQLVHLIIYRTDSIGNLFNKTEQILSVIVRCLTRCILCRFQRSGDTCKKN